MQTPFIIKLPVVLILTASVFFVSVTNEVLKNDLQEENLNGKIMSIREINDFPLLGNEQLTYYNAAGFKTKVEKYRYGQLSGIDTFIRNSDGGLTKFISKKFLDMSYEITPKTSIYVYKYNKIGKLQEIALEKNDSNQAIEQFIYDKNGKLVLRKGYDIEGKISYYYHHLYNSKGELSEFISSGKDSIPNLKSLYSYENNKLTIANTYVAKNKTWVQNVTTIYKYDKNGNWLSLSTISQSEGKKDTSVTSALYLKFDSKNNWLQREITNSGSRSKSKTTRTIQYY